MNCFSVKGIYDMGKEITGLFDMHCHILYGVDDGSKDGKMSFNMLSKAYSEGIRNIICTPHYNYEAWKKTPEELIDAFNIVKKLAEEKFQGMRLYPGSEIFYKKDITDNDLMNHKLPTMAGSRYILMEFVTSVSFEYIREAVRMAVSNGYIPIIAHVNRFDALFGDIDRIEKLYKDGAYMQLNAGSITGKEGRLVKKFCKELLDQELCHFIGTDAHRDSGVRQMEIQEAAQKIRKKYGEDYMEKLFNDNPRHILLDEYLD